MAGQPAVDLPKAADALPSGPPRDRRTALIPYTEGISAQSARRCGAASPGFRAAASVGSTSGTQTSRHKTKPGFQAVENIRLNMARENGSNVSERPPGTPSTLQSKVRFSIAAGVKLALIISCCHRFALRLRTPHGALASLRGRRQAAS